MKDILNFLIEVGKLKRKARRGWQVHQIKNPETTAEHIFHLAILVFVLGKIKKINLERAIKMALIHDLCEVYSPDLTPYDPLLPKNKKKIIEVLKKWPKFTPALKTKAYKDKYKSELKGLEKLISKLSPDFRAEIKNLWLDFEKGLTKEGRFVKQADKVANLLQGLEYWKKYGRIQHKLWMRWIREWVDDPVLIEFVGVMDEEFHKKGKR